jgi:hypothetical protein
VEERTGVLVLRAWLERERVDGFRARITATLDLEAGRERVLTAATPDGVLAIVEAWLEEFVHGVTPP